MFHRLGQQARDKGIEPFPAEPLHGAQLRADPQLIKALQGLAGIGKTGGLQPGTPVSVVFGRPLLPSYYDPGAGKERYQEASERIMAAIARLESPEPAVI